MDKSSKDKNVMKLFFYYFDLERYKLIEILNSYFDKNGIAVEDSFNKRMEFYSHPLNFLAA